MIILLRAEFTRLFKSREWYLSMLFMVLLALFRLYSAAADPANHFKDGFFIYVLFIGVLMAVFVSLFVGSEHHYGTIRNKLVIGHTRRNIYLAELLVCMAAGWSICLVPALVGCLAGIPVFGFPKTGLPNLFLTFSGSLLLSMVYSSLFVLLTLLCSNRTITAIVGLLSALTLFIIGLQIYNALSQPETYTIMNVSPEGEAPTEETIENPYYLKGGKRSVYLFLNEFLPGSQTLHLSQMIDESQISHEQMVLYDTGESTLQTSSVIEENQTLSGQMTLYDIILILASSCVGIILFQKKDLK